MPPAPHAILYSFRRCPYAMRARLAISSLNEPVELREVILRDKPQSMLDASPKATVPVLIERDSNIIDESIDIMDWALAKDDPLGWLSPQSVNLEQMRELINTNDTEFKAHLDRYKYANRYEEVDAEFERQQCCIFLERLDNLLQSNVYLYGSEISLADMAIAPFVRQFANVDRDWFDIQSWSGLLRWLQEFLSSERFSAIMPKYDQWKPGNTPIFIGGKSLTVSNSRN